MRVLTGPHHPLVATVLGLAGQWAGHLSDAVPALTHAMRVAATLGRHLPSAPLVAAVLIDDSPEFVPPSSTCPRS